MLDEAAAAYQPFMPFAAWADLAAGGVWNEFLAELHEMRGTATEKDLEAALKIALRSAALESGAIEGLYSTSRGVTRTVALQGAMWEAELDKLGQDVRGHFEAQLEAFELVLDIATGRRPITEAWLRSLHSTACAAQVTYRVLTEAGWQDRELQHGGYKESPNNVVLVDGSTHWYAPVVDVSAEMHRLVLELNSTEFDEAHAVIQAAYAHHALTAIHPFSDGNGRVARALASVFLYRAAGIPLVIFSDQQEPYWDALAAADDGRPGDFVAFIDDRGLDAIALVTDRLRDGSRSIESQTAALRSLFRAHDGLTHTQINSVAQRLRQHLRQQYETQFAAIGDDLKPDLHGQFIHDIHARQKQWDRAYHELEEPDSFWLVCHHPLRVEVFISARVGIAKDTENRFAFIVADVFRRETPSLKLRVADLHPGITAAAEARIEGWVRRTLSVALDELQNQYSAALQDRGVY